MSNGYSGMTQRSAAPAIVGRSAVNPAYRPNTSMTRKRSCEPAVVRSWCAGPIVRVTHVEKPIESAVPGTLLSIVFGIATTFTPSSWSRLA